jgi:hypothetical protein
MRKNKKNKQEKIMKKLKLIENKMKMIENKMKMIKNQNMEDVRDDREIWKKR